MPFILQYRRDEDWYVGQLKGVPGVVSQGKSLTELEENIRDAYRMMTADEDAMELEFEEMNRVADYDNIYVYGPNFNEFSHSWTKALNSVPVPVMKRLRKIQSAYISRGSFALVYERLNGRTVTTILAEFDQTTVSPIAEGEIDGVKYQLYGAPKDGLMDEQNDKSGEEPAG